MLGKFLYYLYNKNNAFEVDCPMPRSKLDILAEVLETARSGTTKTRIVSQANLNQKLTTNMLSLLVDLNLLAATQNSPISYGTTEKGLRFLHEYRRMQRLLDSELTCQQTL